MVIRLRLSSRVANPYAKLTKLKGGSGKLLQCSGRKPKASPGETGRTRGRAKRVCRRMGKSSNPIETLTPQTQEKRYNTAPYCVSSMDSAAPEPQVDLTVGADDVVDGPATSKGHRGLDDTWDHFKKIKLDSNAAKTLHRNYDAICKGCAERVVGKPEKMRRHLVNCSKAAPTSQLHARNNRHSVLVHMPVSHAVSPIKVQIWTRI